MQNGELNGSGEYKDKQGGGAGLPLSKIENNEGKKTLTNGMSRVHRILTEDEISQGKTTRWSELEIHGRVRNLSTALWQVQHLSALFLNGNQLTRVPPEISQLTNLTMLDLSHNKLRSLPAELGDMISLCHLYLNHNQLRVLPYELGKLFRIQTLGLQGNPLSPEINKIYHENNGSHKLLQFLLDHLAKRMKPCPEPSISSKDNMKNSPGGGKGAGKRFARRAKRWAELQQRRQSQRGVRMFTDGIPDPPRLYDFVELTRMGSGIIQADDGCTSGRLLLGSRRSLPYSILQPKRQEVPMYFSTCENGVSSPLYMTQGLNEYGQHTYISIYQTAPELTIYPPLLSRRKDHSPLTASPSPDFGDMLSLITADLSATSITSPNSSPLSTSISSQDTDDYFIYSHGSFSKTDPVDFTGELEKF
uniref:Leucine rich repeat containing 36 n=1 Tax=Heterorhabditis bacteriophora TaxID=37862 RepID=A0A1I7XDI4_HETBA